MATAHYKVAKILKEDGKIISQDNQRKKLKPKRIKKKLLSNKQKIKRKNNKKSLLT